MNFAYIYELLKVERIFQYLPHSFSNSNNITLNMFLYSAADQEYETTTYDAEKNSLKIIILTFLTFILNLVLF